MERCERRRRRGCCRRGVIEKAMVAVVVAVTVMVGRGEDAVELIDNVTATT